MYPHVYAGKEEECGLISDPDCLNYMNDDEAWPQLQSLVMV
jgi:hypothetical protein